MCWNIEASATLTVVGTTALAVGMYRKQPKELLIPLGYFACMEGIQAFTYPVIDACGSSLNQILTVIGFIHIAFQPFFINMVMMYFISEDLRKKIAVYIYLLCGFAAAVTLLQLYPFTWAGSCTYGMPLCGSPLCSISGEWHLAWNVPLNGLMNVLRPMPFMGLPGYFIVGLLLPFLYGSWRANLYHIVLGPLLAYLLTNNINEAGAVWCTFSVALLLSVLGERPIRKYLRVPQKMEKESFGALF